MIISISDTELDKAREIGRNVYETYFRKLIPIGDRKSKTPTLIEKRNTILIPIEIIELVRRIAKLIDESFYKLFNIKIKESEKKKYLQPWNPSFTDDLFICVLFLGHIMMNNKKKKEYSREQYIHDINKLSVYVETVLLALQSDIKYKFTNLQSKLLTPYIELVHIAWIMSHLISLNKFTTHGNGYIFKVQNFNEKKEGNIKFRWQYGISSFSPYIIKNKFREVKELIDVDQKLKLLYLQCFCEVFQDLDQSKYNLIYSFIKKCVSMKTRSWNDEKMSIINDDTILDKDKYQEVFISFISKDKSITKSQIVDMLKTLSIKQQKSFIKFNKSY